MKMQRCTKKEAARLLLLSILGVLSSSCGVNGYYTSGLELDSSLDVLPIGPQMRLEPLSGSYYYFVHTGTGLTLVEDLKRKPSDGRREQLLYLETNKGQLLTRTVKDDEILRGPFGTVYVNKTCFYGKPFTNGYSSVSVGSYSNENGHELPVELNGKPDNLPPLTSISLVRIFRTDPGYIIVSGNYENTGELGSLHVDQAKSGDWITGGHSFPPNLKDDPRLQVYGIPVQVDVGKYLRLHRILLPNVGLQQVLSLLNQHYGYDKVIREDMLRNGVMYSSRYLRPSVTKEEEILDIACEARFSQQRAMGLRTVE